MNDKANKLLDELLAEAKSPEEVIGPDGLLRQLKKAALERMLEAEMTEHLGYAKHAPEGYDGGNSRNGHAVKNVITDDGTLEIAVPRDRAGGFEPAIVKKGQRRLEGFDEKLVALYARGMTVREIREFVKEMYGVDVSPDLVSRVTDQVHEQVKEWQGRQLEEVYPILYLDAFVVKVRDNGLVRNKAVYTALGINMNGHKEVLGLWIADTEGAKFWMQVITELRNRGVKDLFIVCCDGLKGFPEAIEAVFPKSIVQTCIVHVVRNSLRLVAWKNRKAVTRDLKVIYRAATEKAALEALDEFEATWSQTYPSIAASWRANWDRICPFYGYAEEIRRVIYTTNPIEALHRQFRKATKTRGAFPTDDAVMKLLWLVVDRASRKWTFPIRNWDLVLQQLHILFEGRVPLEAYGR